jgi:hypothetical protein
MVWNSIGIPANRIFVWITVVCVHERTYSQPKGPKEKNYKSYVISHMITTSEQNKAFAFLLDCSIRHCGFSIRNCTIASGQF